MNNSYHWKYKLEAATKTAKRKNVNGQTISWDVMFY